MRSQLCHCAQGVPAHAVSPQAASQVDARVLWQDAAQCKDRAASQVGPGVLCQSTAQCRARNTPVSWVHKRCGRAQPRCLAAGRLSGGCRAPPPSCSIAQDNCTAFSLGLGTTQHRSSKQQPSCGCRSSYAGNCTAHHYNRASLKQAGRCRAVQDR